MSYYRDVYLKSDDWKSLRKERILKSGCRCDICGTRTERLDAHHLKYRRLHNVSVCDLRAVCRRCHDAIHLLLKKYPKLKTLGRAKQWQVVVTHLKKLGIVKETRHLSFRLQCERHFSLCRIVLLKYLRVIRANRMKWNDQFAVSYFLQLTPLQVLSFYTEATGDDPRRGFFRQSWKKLLPFNFGP